LAGRQLVFDRATLADVPWATVWPRVASGRELKALWPRHDSSPTWANVAFEIAALGWWAAARRTFGSARLARLCEVIFSPVIFARSLSPARMRVHAPACVGSGEITSLTSQEVVSGWWASVFSARLAKIVTSQIARLARLRTFEGVGVEFATNAISITRCDEIERRPNLRCTAARAPRTAPCTLRAEHASNGRRAQRCTCVGVVLVVALLIIEEPLLHLVRVL